MSLPRPRLDYSLTVGPLLLALLAFTYVPAVSGEYKTLSYSCAPRPELPSHVAGSLLGNRIAERRRAPARWTRRRVQRSRDFSAYAPLSADSDFRCVPRRIAFSRFPRQSDSMLVSARLLSVSKISTISPSPIARDRIRFHELCEYSANDRHSSRLPPFTSRRNFFFFYLLGKNSRESSISFTRRTEADGSMLSS